MSIFDAVQIFAPNKNSFDLSHEKKLSMNMGDLVPIFQQDILPGDTFKVNSETLIRLAPMLAPIMHRVNVYTHYFFVPNRLTWNEWEDFITGGEDGLQAPPFPKLDISSFTPDGTNGPGTLSDYLGIPVPPPSSQITQKLEYSALPFRAYQHIYNEYYRDQNLEPKVDFSTGASPSGEESLILQTLRKRAWEKDYFTSALPFAQRGGEVDLPVNSEFTPQYRPIANVTGAGLTTDTPLTAQDDTQTSNNTFKADGLGVGIENLENTQTVDSTSVTIAELRKATRLQEWLEISARAGSRYIEQIKAHFGVTSKDARLQRPEYLGGGKQPIVISEVLATAGEQTPTDLEPLGQMAGHGISVGKTNTFKKSFTEHGIILGIMSVIPRTTYEQGIDRSLIRFDKFEYFWPKFAHIGEQKLLNKELFVNWASETYNDETFGYQSRYAEYKYKQSSVHGDFRTGANGEVNLSYWHMGRVFDTPPALNSSFVQSDPTHKIFAVDSEGEHKLYVQVYNKVKALRPIPFFNNPKL